MRNRTARRPGRRNAGKRWLARQAQHLAGRRVTLLGDDLYCNQPFCEGVLAQRLNFIFTCKPDSHTALYEEVELLDRLGAVSQLTQRHWTGKAHEVWIYRYVNDVPLRAGPDALKVNWCELTIVQADTGEQLYHNGFATNHRLTDESVASVVAAGRARWQIENVRHDVAGQNMDQRDHDHVEADSETTGCGYPGLCRR
jgi:hypothetical protein